MHKPGFKNYFIILLCVLTLILFFAAAVSQAENVKRQRIAKGKTITIDTDYEIGDAAVSDSRVCEFMITESRRELYVNAKQDGSIMLTIWDHAGKKRDVVPIEVATSAVDGIANEAKTIFQDSNVEVKAQGKRVILSGDALSKSEVEQARSLSTKHPEIENNVMMSKEVLQTIAEEIEKAIGTPGIRVRNIRGSLVLEGLAYSGNAAKRALEIAKLYEPGIINLVDVKETGRRPGVDRLVKLDVYFMEVKKEILRSFGVTWSPGSMPKSSGDKNGGIVDGIAGAGTSIIGFAFNLLPKLKFLREKGSARVLENASLIVKSGESGDFFNGTQVPFYSGDQVAFKESGVKIHAEPIAAADSIDLNLSLTLSSVAANISAGIDTKTVTTSAYVRSGQSVILANMVSNRDVKTYNKVPSNVDTSSALFNLALSKDFQAGRTEFVVFIEPTIIDSPFPAEEKMNEYLETEQFMSQAISKKSPGARKDGDSLPDPGTTRPSGRKKW